MNLKNFDENFNPRPFEQILQNEVFNLGSHAQNKILSIYLENGSIHKYRGMDYL